MTGTDWVWLLAGALAALILELLLTIRDAAARKWRKGR
jgi:hypothetical protein